MPVRPMNDPLAGDDDLRRYKELEAKKQEMRNTKREDRATSKYQQNLEKMKKQMEYFDSSNQQQGLTLNDFHTMKYAGGKKPLK